MSDKANCKNCIHFDEIKRRCCLNDDSWVQKECYFRRNNRKPMDNDVIFEKQGEIIKDLQSQLDQAKSEITKYKILLNDMETENSHLETMLDQANERLKGAIVPKFKVGKEIYFVIDKVEKGKIEKVFITVSKNDDENSIFYSITDTYGYALRLPEEQAFATEQEAQDKLKEIQGNE